MTLHVAPEELKDLEDMINQMAFLQNENTRLRADADRLVEELSYVIKTAENSNSWWMDCPDRGGFNLDRLRAALKAHESKPSTMAMMHQPDTGILSANGYAHKEAKNG